MTDYLAGTTRWQKIVTQILLRDEPARFDTGKSVMYAIRRARALARLTFNTAGGVWEVFGRTKHIGIQHCWMWP
jgi:hypothetical protein